jgi:hypothetical protein
MALPYFTLLVYERCLLFILFYFIILPSAPFFNACVFASMLIFRALQEWPEEDYPIYANGPGYVISSDIAGSILSEFLKHKLRVSSVDCF